MSQGMYLYCIIRGPQRRAFPEVPALGPGPVQAVTYDGLAAVVSESAALEYEATRANLMAHQRVLERIMGEFTLLPVRFGTVASPPSPLAAIRRLLEKRAGELGQLLEEMEGKVELGLKARWRDEKAVFQEVLAENPALRQQRDALAAKPPGAVRMEAMALGEGVKQALEKKRTAEAERILARLRPLAERLRVNLVLGDAMVLNAALLAVRRREGEIDALVGKLDQELGGRLAFKYVGPVPPYNFVNLVVNWEEL